MRIGWGWTYGEYLTRRGEAAEPKRLMKVLRRDLPVDRAGVFFVGLAVKLLGLHGASVARATIPVSDWRRASPLRRRRSVAEPRPR
jgi:hypothetical protein